MFTLLLPSEAILMRVLKTDTGVTPTIPIHMPAVAAAIRMLMEVAIHTPMEAVVVVAAIRTAVEEIRTAVEETRMLVAVPLEEETRMLVKEIRMLVAVSPPAVATPTVATKQW
jgi:hypothetical protein